MQYNLSVWPIPSHPHRSTQIYLEYIRSFRAVVPSQFLANNGIHPPYASPANHVGVQGARPFKCFREAGCFTHTFKGRVGSERPRDCGTHLLRYHLRLRLGLAFVFGSQGFGDGDAYTVCVPMCHDNLKGGTNVKRRCVLQIVFGIAVCQFGHALKRHDENL